MTPAERLSMAASAMQEYNKVQLNSIDDYTPDDLARLASETEIEPKHYSKLIGVMIYIRKRHVEGLSRVDSFMEAFPERCVYSEEELSGKASEFQSSRTEEMNEKGHIAKSSISVKAKRLENSKMYIKVYQLLQMNLYINYAVERMKVLDEALDKSLSPHVSDRDKPAFMKLFLEETRKPENAKGLELNVNISNNDVSIVSVEDRMNTIAQAVNHATAGEIIDMLQHGKELGKEEE